MPTYVYKFVETGETVEVQQAFTDDALTEVEHPTTGTRMKVRKVFTPVGVTFKGGGFYKTDSRGGKSKSSSTSSTSTDSSSSTSTSSSDRHPIRASRATRAPAPRRLLLQRRHQPSQRRLPTERLTRPIQSASDFPQSSTRSVEGGQMHQLAWVRLIVARHPWIYWLSITVVAGMVGLGAARALADVDAARRSWGEQQTVWVAAAATEPGQPILAGARSVPRAVVPAGAVGSTPEGSIARQRIGPGEIIVGSDISATGSVGLIPEAGLRSPSPRRWRTLQ